MANEVATRTNSFTAVSDEAFGKLANEASKLKGGGDGMAFMKFSGNDGDYAYGADDTSLELGTQLVMNPMSYKRGWIIWVDGEVVHEDMYSIEQGEPPTKGQLPDKGPYGEEDGPNEQYSIEFKMVDEPFVEMIFQANNVSKRRALAKLLKDFGSSYKAHPGLLPVVEINEREFESKGQGKRKYTKHAPVFDIVDWISPEKLSELSEGAAGDYTDADEGDQEAEQVVETKQEVAPKKEATKQAARNEPVRAGGSGERRSRFS